mmetsp:Transcript_22926/g.32308  ORF Transcript_22926/g.32308 Transcript_22926/m.32308 type:complete len:639 (+) Transcript_22926:268-2184(+)|eukprot:CAMPEP_0184870202 /NCGR_PEP_ID=MMETSP0580-20130426/36831_1 /TAXON_ID=1118495 /ORGANISM="Dactyliosolen fragilissimus" /LENGTH=638 /DNA_ID=CAMNT_0027372177 /DNA_START=245 /DNA_END=2161 /DNA_ORIENTATION=-
MNNLPFPPSQSSLDGINFNSSFCTDVTPVMSGHGRNGGGNLNTNEKCLGCGMSGFNLFMCEGSRDDAYPPKTRFCPKCMIGKKVRVFWPVDQQWYVGIVLQYDQSTGEHHLRYNDGDTEWVKIGEGNGQQQNGPPDVQNTDHPYSRSYDNIGEHQAHEGGGDHSNQYITLNNSMISLNNGVAHQQQLPQQLPPNLASVRSLSMDASSYPSRPMPINRPSHGHQHSVPPQSNHTHDPNIDRSPSHHTNNHQHAHGPLQRDLNMHLMNTSSHDSGANIPKSNPNDNHQQQSNYNGMPYHPMQMGYFPNGPVHQGMALYQQYRSQFMPGSGSQYPPMYSGYHPNQVTSSMSMMGTMSHKSTQSKEMNDEKDSITKGENMEERILSPSSSSAAKRKSGPKTWTKQEDSMLLNLVQSMRMPMKWSIVAQSMPERTGKQCRERYVNHLNPRLKNTDWSPSEDATIFHLFNTSGSQWAKMSKMIPGRTDNGIKNRFHNLRRQLEREDEHRIRLSKPQDFPDEIRLDRLRTFPQHLRGKSDQLWEMSDGIAVLAAQSMLGGTFTRSASRFGPFKTADANGEQCARCGLFAPSTQCGQELCARTKWCLTCTRIPPHMSSNLLRECINLRRCQNAQKLKVIEAWDKDK